MTDIKRDVDFTVDVQDIRITEAGFGVLAVMAAHVRSKNRVDKFADDEAAALIFEDSTDPVRQAMKAAFDQEGEAGRIEEVAVIRQLVDNVVLNLPTASVDDRGDVVTVTVTSALADHTYTLDVNDAEGIVTYTANAADTPATIAAQLVSGINAQGSNPVTAADTGDGTFTLTADVPDTSFDMYVLTFLPGKGGPPLLPSHFASPQFTVTGGYKIEINDIIFTRTSTSTSTNITIADGLATWIELVGTTAFAIGFGATGNGDGTMDIDIVPATVDYLLLDEGADFVIVFDFSDTDSTKALSRGVLLYHAPSASETIDDTLLAAKDDDDDTYAVGSIYVSDADISELAAAIASLAKIHTYSTEALDVGDPSDDTDIMSALKALAFNRTFGTFREDATTFFEFAQAGDRLPTIPGSSTWKYKTLVNQAPDKLSSTFERAVLAKNGNVYTIQGGSGTTAEGQMASGRFIDVQRSADYLEAVTGSAILASLKQEPKVDLETEYVLVFGNILDGLYDAGGRFNSENVTAAILKPTNQEFYRRTIPLPAELSDANRIARNVEGIKVETRFSGAVHKVTGTIIAGV